jgi:hypothetical protein
MHHNLMWRKKIVIGLFHFAPQSDPFASQREEVYQGASALCKMKVQYMAALEAKLHAKGIRLR